MNDKTKNTLIGLFVTGAVTIMIVMVLFFKPTVGDGKKMLKVRFTNIAGISVGTRVTFAGKPVGEVTHIQELPNARKDADAQGRVFLYQLTLKVDSSVDVYSTDDIAIRTTGLMGEKSIGILPKVPLPGAPPAIQITDQVMLASSTDPLENTFTQVTRVATRLELAIGRLDNWFEENQGHLTTAIKSFDGAMSQVDAILGAVDQENLVPAVRESVALLSDNLNLIRSSLDDDQLLHKVACLTSNLNDAANAFNCDGVETLHNFNQISRDIANGTGTLGRFIVSDDFYLRMASLMNKGETLMNDVNHYGVLFQYNKQWQRARTRKANFLNSLNSPQEFRNYFEGEVDSMTTSIGRISELMDRANGEDRERICQSEAFKRDFANLLRQVQGVTDSLKLYNEGLVADCNCVKD